MEYRLDVVLNPVSLVHWIDAQRQWKGRELTATTG